MSSLLISAMDGCKGLLADESLLELLELLLWLLLLLLLLLLLPPQVGRLPVKLSIRSAISSSCFGLTSVCVSRWVLRFDLWLKERRQMGHVWLGESSM